MVERQLEVPERHSGPFRLNLTTDCDTGPMGPTPRRFLVHLELKITPLVTQNQQSTSYLSHNWNSEFTLYANKQTFDGNY